MCDQGSHLLHRTTTRTSLCKVTADVKMARQARIRHGLTECSEKEVSTQVAQRIIDKPQLFFYFLFLVRL